MGDPGRAFELGGADDLRDAAADDAGLGPGVRWTARIWMPTVQCT
ncbi:hypothetical protein JOF29_006578 [Kribbella aluminosa]|uniref:Uncharacterized protein n=1 Tax=Kribbella aluminosa TaxID=416017 RepID=A0ABS4UUY9_9ACTN|nr:hypothetical protein [Kribbella aluminosa]MBP2355468.1 hypothetical protein [Kribbella aluminosa]